MVIDTIYTKSLTLTRVINVLGIIFIKIILLVHAPTFILMRFYD
ncbi:MAG: hypothetical protein ACJAXH_003016, partial [Colwellia sp.]